MVLTRRQLNRTLLARQHLLERSRLSVVAMLEALVGMQAQEEWAPYPSLWSRVEGFRPEHLGALIESGEAVRVSAMRATMHVFSAADAARARAVTQPVLDAVWRTSGFTKALAADGVDVAAVVADAHELLTERPLTTRELRAALVERWPQADAGSLVPAATFLLPLAQTAPRAVWGQGGPVRRVPIALDPEPDAAALLERYLRAFGPATVADARMWSRLTGVREVLESLGDRLRVLRDEDGRELFDVADGPIADPDVKAPVRLLGDFDNLCLAHADRSRIIPPEHDAEMRKMLGHRVVLVGGWVRGRWSFEDDGLVVEPWDRWSQRQTAAVGAEARRWLRWARPERSGTVTFRPS